MADEKSVPWHIVAYDLYHALKAYYYTPCPVCQGDCSSANPSVDPCPPRAALDALITYKLKMREVFKIER